MIEKAMRLEIQKVLMERELDLEQFERLEQMLRGAKDFLIGSTPKTLRVPGGALREDPLLEEAQKIRDARFSQLGFTPEQIQRLINNPFREREHRSQTEGLIRAAQLFGVGDDEENEEPEVEEIPTPVGLFGKSVWLPIQLVDRLIYVLADSDGDVADHLVDIVNDCRAQHESIESDAVLPVDGGLVHLIALGLADPKVVVKYQTEVKELEEQVLKCVAAAAVEQLGTHRDLIAEDKINGP